MESLEAALERSMAEREARRPDIVEILAEQLRDSEWARSCSPTGPDEQSIEWARMRVGALLDLVREHLLGDPAIEHAEPVIEETVHAAQVGAALVPGPAVTSRKAIAAAMRAVRFPEPGPDVEGLPPADPAFDVFANAALRCGCALETIAVGKIMQPATPTTGETTWAFVMCAALRQGAPTHGLRTLWVAATEWEIQKAGLEIIEHAVRVECEDNGLDFVYPNAAELAAYRAEEEARRAARAAD